VPSLRTVHAGLLAFVLGAAIRAVPELAAGPNLIGNDTMLYAGLLTRATSCLTAASSLAQGTSPLLFLMLCPFGKIANPILVMKATPIVLFGLLAGSLFYFLTRALKRNVTEAILVTVFVLIQTATLRISWDLHRNVLALSLLLFLLASLKPKVSSFRAAFLLLLSALVFASHELVGILMTLIVVLLVVFRARVLPEKTALFLIPGFAAAFLWFVLVVSRIPAPEFQTLLVSQSQVSLLTAPEIAFFTVLFLPLIPLAIIGWRSNSILSAWLGVTGVLGFSPLLPSPVALAIWDRWMLMLIFPVGIIAGIGLVRIPKMLLDHIPGVTRKIRPYATACILIAIFFPFVVVAHGFMTAPPEHPFFVFDNPVLWRAGSSGIPSTMQSNTVDFAMASDIQRVLEWLTVRMNSTSVLLTHDAFYGYALLDMPSRCNIIWYGYYGVEWGLSRASAQAFRLAYLIWFTPGSGWHSPDPDLSAFKLVYQSGLITLYVTTLAPS
jgi:hypothetical protein